MQKENEFLLKKFRERGVTIAELLRASNSVLTHQSYSKYLNLDRGVDTETLLIMCSELGNVSPAEIKQLLVARGKKTAVIANLIAPDGLSAEDQRFLDKIHALGGDPKKIKLVSDLLDSLRG